MPGATSRPPAPPTSSRRGTAASLTAATIDWMPRQFITFRAEYNHRAASVPYFSGPGGTTPPGGNAGAPGSEVEGWAPDLRKAEDRLNFAVLVKL